MTVGAFVSCNGVLASASRAQVVCGNARTLLNLVAAPERIPPVVQRFIAMRRAFGLVVLPHWKAIASRINGTPIRILCSRKSCDGNFARESRLRLRKSCLRFRERETVGAAGKRGRELELQGIVFPSAYIADVIRSGRLSKAQIAARRAGIHSILADGDSWLTSWRSAANAPDECQIVDDARCVRLLQRRVRPSARNAC
jgi:hypothetical protein